MTRIEARRTPTPEALRQTAEFFQPERFDFEAIETGRHWRKETDSASVDFVALDWYDYDLLPGIVQLQADVWGMDAIDVVPHNILAIARATGGGVVGAYDSERKLIGGALWLGSNTRWVVSHMVGVVEEHRYSRGLGHNLKLLQACLVARDGYQGMEWTYDPLRGANARLNIEKLGAFIELLTLNKYGSSLRSLEYGTANIEMPTDRFTADWDLSDPRVQERVLTCYRGQYQPMHTSQCADIPLVTIKKDAESGHFTVEHPAGASQLRVAIPAEIGMVNDDPKLLADWRFGTRAIFQQLLTTHHGRNRVTEGGYIVTGFATGQVNGQRESYYVLNRKTAV